MQKILFFVLFGLQSPAWGVSVDDQAPLFSLEDLRDGSLVQLEQYRGKIIYVDFWASWCIPCRQSFPVLSMLRTTYAEQGFEVIAVNLDENPFAAEKFLENYIIEYPIVRGYGTGVSELYEVIGMPTGYFIDGGGNVRLIHLGFKTEHVDFLEAVLQKLLAEL